MAFQIVLLSGSVASGKTALWQQLTKSFPAERIHVLRTKNVMRELASKRLGRELPAERRAMQDFGDQLDRDTSGQWVRDALTSLVNEYVSTEASPSSWSMRSASCDRSKLYVKHTAIRLTTFI